MNYFIGVLFVLCSFIAAADEDLSLEVPVGEPSFVVTLAANPTTGYEWSVVQFDKKLLSLDDSHFEKPKTNLIGAGGQMHFTFSLHQGVHCPASTAIQFRYARSWEPNSGTMKTVTVRFVK